MVGRRNTDRQTVLNVAAWQPRCIADGPGERFGLWVQGCPHRCPGCFNQEMLEFKPRHLLTVDEMAAKILSREGLEGVTYSGGEPMMQAKGLALLSERVRASGLTVMCYSGYTLEELRENPDPWIQRLLSRIDILIDGPYVQQRAENLPWRGSSNQQVRFLTPVYSELAGHIDEQEAEMELRVDNDGFTASGIWRRSLMRRLEDLLGG